MMLYNSNETIITQAKKVAIQSFRTVPMMTLIKTCNLDRRNAVQIEFSNLIIIYIDILRNITQMQGGFKVQNKFSHSPNRINQNVFAMRVRIGKKLTHTNHKLMLDLNSQNHRHFSQSARKPKVSGNKLFSGAHKIDSKETYLHSIKIHKQRKKKEKQNHMSPSNGQCNSNKIQPRLKNLRIRSFSKLNGNRKGRKDIQRTVSIAIKGKKEDLPPREKLMSTLTNIILGGERYQDDFNLQILGQSSIHGEQQNFILLDSLMFKEPEHTRNINLESL